jgi:two-component system, LytTR family, response regulator
VAKYGNLMIQALIVDDEQNNLDNLQFMLENDCVGIAVAGRASNGAEARMWLQHNKADVVFLDISMPLETGLEMLEKITIRDFKVVFITAHNEYAMQAIKASAIDYILKPINIEELQKAVQKLHDSFNNHDFKKQNEQMVIELLKNIKQTTAPTKIALPQMGSTTFLDVSEIVSIQADSNYSIIHKQDMQKIVVTKILKDFEDILDDAQFVRIHKSHIINLQFVKEYSTLDGGIVKMKDGNEWPVSRRQIDTLLQKMKDGAVLFFK